MPGVDDAVLAAAARPCLTELRISRCPAWTDASLAKLLAVTPDMHTLCANMTAGVSDNLLACLALHCPKLRTLEVRKCARLKTEDALIAVVQNGALERLDCSLVKAVSGALLIELAAVCGATLQELDISFCRNVQSAAFGHMLDHVSALREVRLHDTCKLQCAFDWQCVNLLYSGSTTASFDVVYLPASSTCCNAQVQVHSQFKRSTELSSISLRM